jgi:hypothetical protein
MRQTVLQTTVESHPGGRIDEDLGAMLDEPWRERLMAMLLLCVVIDGTLDAKRLAVVQHIGTIVDRTPEVVASLGAIARERVLLARICMVRRICRDMFHLSLWRFAAEAFGSMVHRDDELVERYRALEQLPEGTYGRELFAFYEDNMFRFPGERGLMAASLTSAHDARHVLAGWTGAADGEIGLAAFESGVSRRPQFDNVMAILLHLCVGIEVLESFIPTRQTPVDVGALLEEMARGAAAPPEILEADWDFWAYTALPVEEVRERLGVSPGGNSAGAGYWAGPAGAQSRHFVLDEVTLLPETDRHLLAMRVDGSLSAEDVEAISDLFSRRAWNDRKIDLVLELSADTGYDDAAAFWSDLKLALHHRHSFRRIAIIGESRWQHLFTVLDRPFARLFGATERYFHRDARDQAYEFARSVT